MEATVATRSMMIVGTKHTGRFADYGSIIPKAAQEFLARSEEIPHKTDVEVTLYEPKRGPEHLEGFFYTGVIVDREPDQLPPGMEFLCRSGRYAVARGDERNTGAIYGFLDNWIREHGFQKAWPDSLFVEVYDKPGTHEVEVCLPLKD